MKKKGACIIPGIIIPGIIMPGIIMPGIIMLMACCCTCTWKRKMKDIQDWNIKKEQHLCLVEHAHGEELGHVLPRFKVIRKKCSQRKNANCTWAVAVNCSAAVATWNKHKVRNKEPQQPLSPWLFQLALELHAAIAVHLPAITTSKKTCACDYMYRVLLALLVHIFHTSILQGYCNLLPSHPNSSLTLVLGPRFSLSCRFGACQAIYNHCLINPRCS